MDLKETGKKLKPFAPVLSVAVVASCVAGSLGGYQPPVYAAQEQTDFVKEETTKSEEQAQVTAESGNISSRRAATAILQMKKFPTIPRISWNLRKMRFMRVMEDSL